MRLILIVFVLILALAPVTAFAGDDMPACHPCYSLTVAPDGQAVHIPVDWVLTGIDYDVTDDANVSIRWFVYRLDSEITASRATTQTAEVRQSGTVAQYRPWYLPPERYEVVYRQYINYGPGEAIIHYGPAAWLHWLHMPLVVTEGEG